MILVNVTVRGDEVSFEAPGEDGFRFVGRIVKGALRGTITHARGGIETVVLPRRCGYWDR